jgi:hypothetical protein
LLARASPSQRGMAAERTMRHSDAELRNEGDGGYP